MSWARPASFAASSVIPPCFVRSSTCAPGGASTVSSIPPRCAPYGAPKSRVCADQLTWSAVTATTSGLQYGVWSTCPPWTRNWPDQSTVAAPPPHSTRSGNVSQPAGRSSSGTVVASVDLKLHRPRGACLAPHEHAVRPRLHKEPAGGGGEDPPGVQRPEHAVPVQPVCVGAEEAGTVAVVGAGDEPETVPPAQPVEDERARQGAVGVLPVAAVVLVVAAAGLEDLNDPDELVVVVAPVEGHHGRARVVRDRDRRILGVLAQSRPQLRGRL